MVPILYGKMFKRFRKIWRSYRILLKSRQISLDEEDVVDGEDFELASCYVGIGDKENAQKYLDSARDSITERGLFKWLYERKNWRNRKRNIFFRYTFQLNKFMWTTHD